MSNSLFRQCSFNFLLFATVPLLCRLFLKIYSSELYLLEITLEILSWVTTDLLDSSLRNAFPALSSCFAVDRVISQFEISKMKLLLKEKKKMEFVW